VPSERASTGARISLINDVEGGMLARIAFGQSRRRYGQVMDPIRVMAHHPKVMAGVAALELASERAKLVPARLKHLAELQAGMIAGCEWCLDVGSEISAEAGVTEDDLRELVGYESSDRFSELEKLVLATGMPRSPVQVPEDLFRQLTPHLGEAQLELTNIIALENFRARFNWAFGLESQGLSEGFYCVGPECRQRVGRACSDHRLSDAEVEHA
jgi:AhpD family alkylhydroperoxidase